MSIISTDRTDTCAEGRDPGGGFPAAPPRGTTAGTTRPFGTSSGDQTCPGADFLGDEVVRGRLRTPGRRRASRSRTVPFDAARHGRVRPDDSDPCGPVRRTRDVAASLPTSASSTELSTDQDARSEDQDAGMSTVEYAVGTIAAAAFAAVLYRIVTGESVVAGLTQLINNAFQTL